MADHDHIIVGSGINALVAAAMLSSKGKRVLVLERSDRFGGCMRTEEITLPGFHHDVMAATFVLFLTSPAHAALGSDLARHGLEFCHTPQSVSRPQAGRLVAGADHGPRQPTSRRSMLSRPAATVTVTPPMWARSRPTRPSCSRCWAENCGAGRPPGSSIKQAWKPRPPRSGRLDGRERCARRGHG
jgi:choline dehydrogenase-like flavoprotein